LGWKKIKKYLEAPKLKMASQFKMAKRLFYQICAKKILKNSRWRPYSIWRFFWHLLLEALAFVRNFKMLKCLHFLEEQT
jgi:hypothetical protein